MPPGTYAVLAPVSQGYSPLQGRLSTCYSPVRHCTHGVAPTFSCDLHVLSAPPALILSRDQTLEEKRPSSELEVTRELVRPVGTQNRRKYYKTSRPTRLSKICVRRIDAAGKPATPRQDRPRNLERGEREAHPRENFENLKDRSGRPYSAPTSAGVLLPCLTNQPTHQGRRLTGYISTIAEGWRKSKGKRKKVKRQKSKGKGQK